MSNKAFEKYINTLQVSYNDLIKNTKSTINLDVYTGSRNHFGLPHGNGKMDFANGDIYIGEWVLGEMHGKGIMTFKNGDIYEGEWNEGKMHGAGKLTEDDGIFFSEIWDNGNCVESIYKDPRDGQEYKTLIVGNKATDRFCTRWMTTNLNYKTKHSFCYDNEEDNAEIYGRLYTSGNQKELCLPGFKIAAKDDFENLYEFLGFELYEDEDLDDYWYIRPNLDDEKFNKLFANHGGGTLSWTDWDEKKAIGRDFENLEEDSCFWLSDNEDLYLTKSEWFLKISESRASFEDVPHEGNGGFSVRCVRHYWNDDIDADEDFELEEDTDDDDGDNLENNHQSKKKWQKTLLKTNKFRNGVEIPVAKNIDEWITYCRAEKAVMCYYKFNPKNHALYNYYAILDLNGLAPKGYAIPTFDIETEVNDDLFSLIKSLSLPTGILKAGRDAQTGVNRKEFSDEIYLATLDIWDYIDDDVEEMRGLMVLDITCTPPEYNIRNGLWGLQVLLVKEDEDDGETDDDDDDDETDDDDDEETDDDDEDDEETDDDEVETDDDDEDDEETDDDEVETDEDDGERDDDENDEETDDDEVEMDEDENDEETDDDEQEDENSEQKKLENLKNLIFRRKRH